VLRSPCQFILFLTFNAIYLLISNIVVTLANMMRARGQDAIQDPTKLEAEVTFFPNCFSIVVFFSLLGFFNALSWLCALKNELIDRMIEWMISGSQTASSESDEA
jgi:hypothetical protein